MVFVLPARAGQVAARQADAVTVTRSFVNARNAQALDATLASFASDAKMQGGDVCCAAQGIDQIRPFVMARFAEEHQIGWTNPHVDGDTLTFVARIFARDGLDDNVSLTGAASPNDPEAAPIEVTVAGSKVTFLRPGISQAALQRAKANRAKSGYWRKRNSSPTAPLS